MLSVQSPPTPTACGLATPTSNAARRPGRAAEVSTSAGRSVGAEEINPSGSISALGSHAAAAACSTSRTALCPLTLFAQQSACAADMSIIPAPQMPHGAGSSGPAPPRRSLTAVTYSTGVSRGPLSSERCHNQSWLHSGWDASPKRSTSSRRPARSNEAATCVATRRSTTSVSRRCKRNADAPPYAAGCSMSSAPTGAIKPAANSVPSSLASSWSGSGGSSDPAEAALHQVSAASSALRIVSRTVSCRYV